MSAVPVPRFSWRFVIEVVIVALLYWAGARLGLRLAFANRNVTAVWPPTGIALAAMFIIGWRVWPGVFVGALVANITNGAGFETSLGIAVGNTLAPLAATEILRRLDFQATLDRVADVAAIVAAGLFGMLVSATLGSLVLLLTGELGGSYGSAWTVWWIGDAMGVLIFAPAVFTVWASWGHEGMRLYERAEAALFLVLMAFASFLFVAATQPLWYLVIPLAIWGALRYRQPIAALTVAAVSSVSVVAVVNDLGPINNLPVTTRLVTLQLFNATLALTVMLFTAVAAERARAWDELQQAANELEDRVRQRSEELMLAQRAAAEASEREATNLRAAIERITKLESIKSDFLQLASHELRGPVGVIRGYVEMLSDGTFGRTPTSMRQAMSVLDTKAEQMGRLVNQMLETARLETDDPVSERRVMDLSEVLRTTVDAAAALAPPQHSFEIEDAEAPAPVYADPDQVGTILGNLLDNAVKYSPRGSVIRARIQRSNGSVAVAVSDSGIGIAEADLGLLFKSFSRVVTPDHANIPGTGLGLYISRKLAVLNDGDLTASSSAGAGSTFTLTLPLVVRPSRRSRRRVQVLEVDDAVAESPLSGELQT